MVRERSGERVEFDSTVYLQVLDQLNEGVYIVDRERRITYWNQGAEQLTGFRRGDIVGSFCHNEILKHVDREGQLLCHNGCPLTQVLQDGHPNQAEVFLQHREGHRVPVHVRVTPIRDATGAIVAAVEVFNRHWQSREVVERLKFLEREALLDPLTGLVNRRHMAASLERHLTELERYGWPFGVLFADIDHFKQINDRFGHATGDKVLKLVALTLTNSLRPFDDIGRWGGEEFLALVANVGAAQLRQIGERARRLVENSDLQIDGMRIGVTISIGATIARLGDTLDSLVDRADQLMYLGKKRGRNVLVVDPE